MNYSLKMLKTYIKTEKKDQVIKNISKREVNIRIAIARFVIQPSHNDIIAFTIVSLFEPFVTSKNIDYYYLLKFLN